LLLGDANATVCAGLRGSGAFERFALVRWLACGIALVVSLAAAAAIIGAGTVAHADAGPRSPTLAGRLFTLAAAPFGPGRQCGSVGAFPDGSVLLVDATQDGVPAPAWRIGLDGARTHVATVPLPVRDVVIDGPTSFIAAARFARRIDRVDLASGTTTLLELPSRPGQSFERVIALDDGSVVAYEGLASGGSATEPLAHCFRPRVGR
jgi:hypothetical protein